MTPFLVATLAALLVVGTLAVLWREQRQRFLPALGAVLLLAVAAGGYFSWVNQGKGTQGDPALVEVTAPVLEEVAGSYRLRGQLLNRHEGLALSVLTLQLVVEDCTTSCRTIFDEARQLRIPVPPGAARPFLQVYPGAVAVQGERRFRGSVLAPRVHPAPAPR